MPATARTSAVGKAASDRSADLRHLARRAEPVKSRRQGLLECRRDRLDAALLATLQQEPRHFLDEQRHAARALCHALDHFPRECVAGCKLANHLPYLLAVEWGESNHSVMRAHTPSWPKLGPSGDENEQWSQRPTFGYAAQYIQRGRIGPMQVFYREHDRLDPRTGHHPVGQRR